MSELNSSDTFDGSKNERVEIIPRNPWNSIPNTNTPETVYDCPVNSIPLLAELSFYTGNEYWKNHPNSLKIWNEIKSFFSSNPHPNSYQNYLDNQKQEVVKDKKSLINEQKVEKKSSLIFDLKDNCEKAIILHRNYMDSLLTGNEFSDYYYDENTGKYLNEFIPICTQSIVNDISFLIYSEKLNRELFIDAEDGRTYREIADSIKDKKDVEKANEFHRLVCIGLSVIRHPTKKAESKVIASRKSESTFEENYQKPN